MTSGFSCMLTGALAAIAAAAPVAADPSVYREAVIIGFNRSPRPALEPLRYADDDAIKLADLLQSLGHRVALLAEPDDDTARLYPALEAQEPRRDKVLAALRAAIDRVKVEIEAGREAELLVAYSGHGDVDPEGRGLVYLADGALTQRDLAHALGDAPERHRVTLLIDACNAALLVGVRGMGSYGDRVPAVRRDADLDHLAHAGLILSTSGRAEVHEWELLLSGIFSYEVRSGLVGAADLDDDQRITFAELDAFVAAANAQIANPIARLAPTIRGPGGAADAVVLDLSTSGARRRLRVTPEIEGHAYVHDENLVRYADFNRQAQTGFWMLLVGERPFSLVTGNLEYPITRIDAGGVSLGEPRATGALAQRGSLHDYYERHLFETPYGPGFAEAHWQADRSGPDPVALSRWETARIVIAPYVVPFAISGGLMVLGGGAYGGGWLSHVGAREARWADETRALNGLASGLAIGGLITTGLGAVAAVGTSAVLGVEVVSWQIQ